MELKKLGRRRYKLPETEILRKRLHVKLHMSVKLFLKNLQPSENKGGGRLHPLGSAPGLFGDMLISFRLKTTWERYCLEATRRHTWLHTPNNGNGLAFTAVTVRLQHVCHRWVRWDFTLFCSCDHDLRQMWLNALPCYDAAFVCGRNPKN